MRALALVTARELRVYAPAGAAALVTALLPWVTPLLPGVSHQSAGELRVVTAAVLAALLGLVLAVFAGAGLLARDLGEGRMGFFLALPLPSWTIWVGRLLAAVVLVYGSMAMVMLPPALAGEPLWRPDALPGWDELPLLAGPLSGLAGVLIALTPLLLVLLSHQLAIALRSRSAWLLADLAGLTLAAGGLAVVLARLYAAAAPLEFALAAAAGSALLFAALLTAGGVGLARGGGLLARVHRVQATVLVVTALATALLLSGFVRWVKAVDAGDLRAVDDVRTAPAGPWVAVVGPLRHRPSYRPWMLVDTASGTSVALAPGLSRHEGSPPLVFAADGRHAVWLRPQGHPFTTPSEIVEVELGPHPRLRPTGIEVARSWDTTMLPLGEGVAIAEARRLTYWAEHGRRLVVATELPRAVVEWHQLRATAPGRVRLVRLASIGEETHVQSWDLDLTAHRLQPLADRSLSGAALAGLALSADGTRLLVTSEWGGRGGARLLDATTGETLTQLALPVPGGYVTAGFLAGGEVAIVVGHQEQLVLRLFDHQGALRREVPLGRGRYAWLGVPWRAGRLPFTANVRAGEGPARHWQGELREVDLASGQVRVLGDRLAPVGGAAPWWPRDDTMAAGSPGSQLFRDHYGTVSHRGPQDGAQRVLPPTG